MCTRSLDAALCMQELCVAACCWLRLTPGAAAALAFSSFLRFFLVCLGCGTGSAHTSPLAASADKVNSMYWAHGPAGLYGFEIAHQAVSTIQAKACVRHFASSGNSTNSVPGIAAAVCGTKLSPSCLAAPFFFLRLVWRAGATTASGTRAGAAACSADVSTISSCDRHATWLRLYAQGDPLQAHCSTAASDTLACTIQCWLRPGCATRHECMWASLTRQGHKLNFAATQSVAHLHLQQLPEQAHPRASSACMADAAQVLLVCLAGAQAELGSQLRHLHVMSCSGVLSQRPMTCLCCQAPAAECITLP